MHIPDNYLSPSTCAVMGAAMVPVWATAVRKVTKEVSRAKIPLLGIGAAFSFLIMMFNIPLPGGTTGHAVGGTLIAVLLGPWSACISVTVALLVQALMFGDGGILAFGANCFNMAFVLPLLGYFTYSFITQRVKNPGAEYLGLAVAAYLGLNAAALFTAVEFGIQPLLFRGADGLPLAPGQHDLPGGVELGGAPGPERFFAVCAPDGSASAADVERAARALGSGGMPGVRRGRVLPGLPAGTSQTTQLLEKRP